MRKTTMHKYIQILLICLFTSLIPSLAQAALSAGDPCDKKDMGHPAITKDGHMLGCMSTDVKWTVIVPKAGDTCFTLKPDRPENGIDGQPLICHDGKWVDQHATTK